MSLWGRKVRFEVNGILGIPKKHGEGGCGGRAARTGASRAVTLYILMMLAAVSLISLVVFAPYGRELQGNVSVIPVWNTPLDVSNYEFAEGFDFSMLPSENTFAVAGETSLHVMTLRFYSEKDVFRLRNFGLKIGGVDEGDISNVEMIGADERTYKGYLLDGYVKFRNLYIKSAPEALGESEVSEVSEAAEGPLARLAPGEELLFDLYLDFSKDLKFGERLYLKLESPEDLDVTISGDRVYLKSTYPLIGPYISIIGREILF
ncbi:MAG: hypothetical protein WC604_04925 [Candidatus Gracilibacteria bacterium]